ncbi:MAG: orotidine-5'-phosphate decarboxylase [Dehalococcoidia bacterium]
MKTFNERLDAAAVKTGSLVCVGLDPDPARMPVKDVAEFNRAIIDATSEFACAYKPQMAFYEALGIDGFKALEQTVQHIRDAAPNAVIIGDAKRCDVGSTAAAYAHAMFEVWGFDAVTLVAYLGADGVEPFLQYPGRGVFIVCRSSNPSARDLQDLHVTSGGTSMLLYQRVAQAAERWGGNDNVGLVVGATYPKELRILRSTHPGLPFLVPGVGAQGGDVATAARAGTDENGRGMVINSSRGILYASASPTGFAKAAAQAAGQLRDEINDALQAVVG